MGTELNKELFHSILNEKVFAIFSEDQKYELEVIEIIEKKEIASLNLIPYSVLFRAAKGQAQFVQCTALLQSEKFGSHHVFLIPRMPDNEGIYYEAVFG